VNDDSIQSVGSSRINPRLLRLIVVFPLVLIVTPAVATGVVAMGASWAVAYIVATLVCLTAAFWLGPRWPSLFGASKGMLWIWLGASIPATYFVTTQSLFMADVSRTEHAFNPTIRELDSAQLAKPFYPKHNCFTCYIVAAYLAQSRVDNLYDRSRYRHSEEPTPFHDTIGDKLTVDTYQYPPPFLLLPRTLIVTGGDFFQLRAYWHAINITLLVVAFVTLMLWVDRTRFHVYWLALPLMLCAPVVRGALQIQNVHLIILGICLLALPAFDTRRNWLGGALLGFAVVSKLFPGLLLVFLLLQRKWRAVAWTCSWMIVYVLLTFAWFGPKPFEAFLDYQLPRLATGEAFWFATKYVNAMLVNSSIWGISYKLEHLGLLSDPQKVARIVMWVYSVTIVVVLLVVGLRRRAWSPARPPATPPPESQSAPRLSLLRVWLALLIVGQLRSPFLPWAYGNVPVLLLLLLLLPRDLRVGRAAWVFATVAMLAVTLPLPFGPTGIDVDFVYSLAATIVVLIGLSIAFLQRPVPLPRTVERPPD